jgi:hypothetical protein
MYLEHYRCPALNEWIDIVKSHDTSSAKLVQNTFRLLSLTLGELFDLDFIAKRVSDWKRAGKIHSEQKQLWAFEIENGEF